MRSFGRIQANMRARSCPSRTPRSRDACLAARIVSGVTSEPKALSAALAMSSRQTARTKFLILLRPWPRAVAGVGGRGDSAGAGPHHRDVVGAGDLANGVGPLVERRDISVEPPIAFSTVGLRQLTQKIWMPLFEQISDEALVGRQIERIELVDLRRRDHQRALPNLGRRPARIE